MHKIIGINKAKVKEEILSFIDSLDEIIEFELTCDVDDITITSLSDKYKKLKLSPIQEMRIKGLMKGLS